MAILEKVQRTTFDVTIMQTPQFGMNEGYETVYRLNVIGVSHHDAIEDVFRTFNVFDLMPYDYRGRPISTGDILLIDEGLFGKVYYKLVPGGWKRIKRVFIK